jgi:colanic acid/amylovoran biosynthesis protein
MKRVLVLWAEPMSPNLGVRVLAEGAEAVVRAVLGHHIEVDHQDFHSRALGAQLHRKSVAFDRLGVDRTWRRALAGYDLVLDTGAGDSLTDIYGLQRLVVMTEVQRAVLRADIPLVLLPQTIGPFRTRVGRALVRSSIRRASLLASRDSVSGSFLSAVFGRAPEAATDMVFALPAVERTNRSRIDVVLNVSGLLWGTNPHVDCNTYRQLIRDVIRGFGDTGRSVTLLAHVLDNPSSDNDISAMKALSSEFPDLPLVVPETLAGVREFLASASVVVGSRMHACLNAISVGTPAIPLAYSRKFAPLLADIGWRHTLDLREKLDASIVLEMTSRPELATDLGEVIRLAHSRHLGFLASLEGVLQ